MDGHLDDQAWKEVPWTESFLGKMFIYSRFTTWTGPKKWKNSIIKPIR